MGKKKDPLKESREYKIFEVERSNWDRSNIILTTQDESDTVVNYITEKQAKAIVKRLTKILEEVDE